MTTTSNADQLTAQLRRFEARAQLAISRASKGIAEDVVQSAVTDIRTSGGGPRRVDTGAYVGAWEDAPVVTKQGHSEVTNPLDYAPAIEFGSEDVEPGLHITRALKKAEKGAKEQVEDDIQAIWERL